MHLHSSNAGLGHHRAASCVASYLLVCVQARVCGVRVPRGSTAVREVFQVVRTNERAAVGVTEKLHYTARAAVCVVFAG